MNIAIRLSTHSFKDDILNIYYSLSICCNLSTYKILAPYLTSFNCHLTGNNSLAI